MCRRSLGRVLDADDDRIMGRRRVVISHAYWQARFAGDPSVVGRTLEVDTFRGGALHDRRRDAPGIRRSRAAPGSGSRSAIGVADRCPVPSSPQRCCPWYTTFGRLKPGVTIERAPGRADRDRAARVVAASRGRRRRRGASRSAARDARRRSRAHTLRSLRRGGVHPPHRMRQRREPAAVTRRRPPPGGADAPRARRDAVAPRAPVADARA